MSDRNRQDPTHRPFHPSRPVKLQEEFAVDAVALTSGVPPTELGKGFDVDKWSSVMVCLHPSDPSFADVVVDGWAVTVRPWKYREAASRSARSPSGQWYALEPWVVPLDGSGAMERTFFVPDAKKLYIEPVSWVNAPAGTPEIAIGAYGLGRYGDPGAPLVSITDGGSSTFPIPLPVIVTNPVWEHIDAGVVLGADTTIGVAPTLWYPISMSTYRKLGIQFDIDPGNDGAGGDGTVYIEMQGRLHSGAEWVPILMDTFGTPTEVITVTGPDDTVISEILADNTEKLAVFEDIQVGLYSAAGNVGQVANIYWQDLY